MSRARLLVCVLCAGLLALVAGLLTADRSHAAGAGAAATPAARTFVSTSGSDANPCTNTQPCRNFATALANTTPGGEVVALSSGGYGPVAIGMAVTLVGAPGVHAAITATSGNAIEVSAGAADTVVLRNLYLNGLGGTDGIRYSSGSALVLEQLTATGFTSGAGVHHLAPNGRLHASDLVLRRNNTGLLVAPASGTAQVSLDRVQARDNATGIWGAGNARLRISDCVASGNTSVGIFATVPTTVSGCRLSENYYGFYVIGVCRIGGSTVTHNYIGLYNGGGTLESFGDNYVRGNTSGDTFGTITTVPRT